MGQNQPNTQGQGMTIPARYPLLVATLGLLIALFVWITQATFNVVGYAGLAMIALGLLAWGVLAPEQAKAALTGRTVRFGGASFVVTVIFLTALIAIYSIVKTQSTPLDLTERNDFSLTDETRQAITQLGADPNTPDIHLLVFYGSTQAGQRDQDSVLFEDYVTASAGRIGYEFVDPERNPALVEQYGIERTGQIAVVAMNDEGEPDVENAEVISFSNVSQYSQEALTNAILQVAASGDFRAYFLSVEDSLKLERDMTTLNDVLVNQLGWTVEEPFIFELTSPESGITLNDPAADGEVLVIPGGREPLSDEQLAIITDYVDSGGNLILFAMPSFEGESLANSENLSVYLWEQFGLRFTHHLIVDQSQAFQSALNPVAIDFDTAHYITTGFTSFQQASGFLVFELPYSIEVAEELPDNVTVTELARSSETAYGKTDLNAILEGDFAQATDDPTGPFVLAAAAENSETGARIVLFGSATVLHEQYAQLSMLGVVNLDAAFNSLVWVTHFNDFFNQVTVPYVPRPQDQPIFADVQTVRNINFFTIFILPFGTLAVGLLVWWTRRERGR